MAHVINQNIDYTRPVTIADGIYWVGYTDTCRGLTDNPYLIIDGDEGILIDGGSRPDFPSVMMKIMQTGLDPRHISTLIYQHYDPDLCGSVTNLEQIIDNPDLKIISQRTNNLFIRHYGVKSDLLCMDRDLGGRLELASGRVLTFHKTPYCHSAGSFMTHDTVSNMLFTSDILGSFCRNRDEYDLFRTLPATCTECSRKENLTQDGWCIPHELSCPVAEIVDFQKELMTSNKAMHHAMEVIASIQPSILAPQHGFIIHRQRDYELIHKALIATHDIGIDGIL